ncbi:MAG: ABC transporter substrate-binding protein [Rhodoferax sp.]|uniref:ABC transporter substrate-binding protein n=1 Tax=Rhodoferax sp. TaxID=50421 RepID=UPI00182CBD2D|nr:ABC transporter substrate-binding protein [Rhodoferax sp.]NMM13002.1 ABC transporter substrate-binding protein [Rhodoferax sp.]NMM19281.1 ABC transporter substrate-binding protein [Rhodoferax sp.]
MDSIKLNRRTFAAATVLSAVSVAAPGLWAQPRLEKTKISIAVGGKAAFYYLPLTIAEQLGYFKAEGLEVEISDFAGGSRALQAVVGGSADVVSGAFEHTINLQSKGQTFQAFVLQGRAPAISMGVSLKTIPHYKTVADLKGKRIGISAPGSSTNMVANLILSRAGLKAGDVSFIGVGTAAGALSAFRSGQIDAMSNVDPIMTMLEQKGEIRIIADTRTLKGTVDVFGGSMPAGCLYAPLEFIQKNPHTVQALTDAMAHSLKWLQTAGPGDIIKTVPEAYLLGDRALYLAAFNKVRESISPDGLIPDEGPRTAARVLASFDPSIKVDKVEFAKTYTNEFAKKAKERFKA